MTSIGPYDFTEHDVKRTLANGRTLFELLPGGLPPDPDWPANAQRQRAEVALDAGGDREEVLEVLWAEWRAAMEVLRRDGRYGASEAGRVVGLFTGDGGVPKQPQARVDVSWSGVVGDRQGDRKNHGRPWQALCVWSAEVIADFAADGHPLAPGNAGENVVTEGLAWERVVPGAQLRLGTVLAEVSSYALPCKTNARWFTDGHFDAMHHRHGAVSRVYATVLEPGSIAAGDDAVLEPGD